MAAGSGSSNIKISTEFGGMVLTRRTEPSTHTLACPVPPYQPAISHASAQGRPYAPALRARRLTTWDQLAELHNRLAVAATSPTHS